MSRQRTMKATVPLLWVVAILAGVFAFVASNQSQDAQGTTTQVFAYPGPVAGPGVPRGPGLGTITIGDSRSGWVGGFSANSQVCYTIDGQDAGCGLTVDRGEVGYAFFVLSIGNN